MTLKAIDTMKISNFLAKYRKAVADQKAIQLITPADLETEITDQILAKMAEIALYRENRPASREEYVYGINILKGELAVLVETNTGIQQRNEARWDAAQAVFNADFDALQVTIESLETKEKTFLDNLTTDPV